ncbi:hypothetical protein AB1Y20_019797 [Prymnesium parvum]|uniref:Poly(A) RNA polymerase mitochondrial-like central palm domain-containing protein n=1 Tax=Prymnesium parvum TaxID=97485 RepID=A0AB34JW63_PRYPA
MMACTLRRSVLSAAVPRAIRGLASKIATPKERATREDPLDSNVEQQMNSAEHAMRSLSEIFSRSQKADLRRGADRNGPAASLARQIVLFTSLCQQAPALKQRREAILRIVSEMQQLRGLPHFTLFGSSSTGVCLPNSDVDIVVFKASNKEKLKPLMEIYCLLLKKRNRKLVKDIVFLRHAKVPILRFRDTKSGLFFDVCANNFDGTNNSKKMRECMLRWPAIWPALLILKRGLQQHSLQQTHTGGIGSYLLFHMLRKTMFERAMHLSDKRKATTRKDAAALLMDFLIKYGEMEYTISMSDPWSRKGAILGQRVRSLEISRFFKMAARGLEKEGSLSSIVAGWPDCWEELGDPSTLEVARNSIFGNFRSDAKGAPPSSRAASRERTSAEATVEATAAPTDTEAMLKAAKAAPKEGPASPTAETKGAPTESTAAPQGTKAASTNKSKEAKTALQQAKAAPSEAETAPTEAEAAPQETTAAPQEATDTPTGTTAEVETPSKRRRKKKKKKKKALAVDANTENSSLSTG